MGDLLGQLLLVGQFLFPVTGIVVIIVVVFRLTSLLAGVRGHDPGSAGPESIEVRALRRTANRTGALIAGSGLSLPWLMGLAVKFRLDAAGEPTYSISSFLDPTAVVILLVATAIQWCSPLLLLAAWVRSRFFTRVIPSLGFADRILVARTAAAGGLVSESLVFYRVFQEWDTMYIFVPLGVFLLPGMGLGWGLGMLLVRRRNRSVQT